MINSCPHCQEPLNLSDTQKQKIQLALDKLPPGNLLKLACPHCQKPFELSQDGTLPDQSLDRATIAGGPKGAKKVSITPPPPPDISWLTSGQVQEKEIIQDSPMVLILMKKGPEADKVRDVFEEEGFLPVYAENQNNGLDRMQFTPFAAVILHTQFSGKPLDSNRFHQFMRNMAMLRRRNIHYTLLGPEFKTLYDLQALSYSANLIVNDKEIDDFHLILKKSLHESQKLFGPLVESFIQHGKITNSIWQDIKVRTEQKMKSAVLKDLLEVKV